MGRALRHAGTAETTGAGVAFREGAQSTGGPDGAWCPVGVFAALVAPGAARVGAKLQQRHLAERQASGASTHHRPGGGNGGQGHGSDRVGAGPGAARTERAGSSGPRRGRGVGRLHAASHTRRPKRWQRRLAHECCGRASLRRDRAGVGRAPGRRDADSAGRGRLRPGAQPAAAASTEPGNAGHHTVTWTERSRAHRPFSVTLTVVWASDRLRKGRCRTRRHGGGAT